MVFGIGIVTGANICFVIAAARFCFHQGFGRACEDGARSSDFFIPERERKKGQEEVVQSSNINMST